MLEISRIVALMFILTAVWQDARDQSISIWVYLVYGFLCAMLMIVRNGGDINAWVDTGGSMGIGLILCVLSRVTRGSIGEGDACFFLVTGMFFNLWENLSLLMSGLLLCSCYCLGMVVWGAYLHIQVRKRTVPFLPFLLPVGLWLVLI